MQSTIRKPSDAETLETVRGLPPVKQAFESRAREIAERRIEVAKALAALEAGAAETNARFDEEQTEVVAGLKAAKDALVLASERARIYQARRCAHSTQVQRERSLLEQELIETANPEIVLFEKEMRAQWDETRKAARIVRQDVQRNQNTGRITRVETAVGVTPGQRIKFIMDAIDSALALRLEPDQTRVPARLTELREAIPNVGASA